MHDNRFPKYDEFILRLVDYKITSRPCEVYVLALGLMLISNVSLKLGM
jgi:hypothetical protein